MTQQTAIPTDLSVLEGMETALNHAVAYARQLGRSIPATPAERSAAGRVCDSLFQLVIDARGLDPEGPEAEVAYRTYLQTWRG